MSEITVYGGVTPFEFSGELLHSFSTEVTDETAAAMGRTRSVRWMEMELYKMESGLYLLHNVGCSDVYHRKGLPCKQGTVMTADQLGERAAPCQRCRPPLPSELADADEIALETDNHSVFPSLQPLEIPRHLRNPAHPAVSGTESSPLANLTYPAKCLLEGAMEKDPALRAALTAPVRLR
jgi:hypothetical protein